MSKTILGIDEAGKNPLMGPMVVAGFLCSASLEEKLRDIGVQDSKAFGSGARARERRRELAAQVRDLGRAVVKRVSVAEINQHKLNGLVHLAGKDILSETTDAEAVFTDGGEYFQKLQAYHQNLTVIIGGDRLNIFVSAASIVAKDERDRCFEEIAVSQRGRIEGLLGDEQDAYQRLLDGNSYPASKLIKKYLTRHREKYGELPPETRGRLVRFASGEPQSR